MTSQILKEYFLNIAHFPKIEIPWNHNRHALILVQLFLSMCKTFNYMYKKMCLGASI